MIYPDRVPGVRLVTDPPMPRDNLLSIEAALYSLHHAPTQDEGDDVVRAVFRAKRGDRYIKSRKWTI